MFHPHKLMKLMKAITKTVHQTSLQMLRVLQQHLVMNTHTYNRDTIG